MKVSQTEKKWVEFVKSGRLDVAYDLYLKERAVWKKLNVFSFKIPVLLLSKFFLILRPELDESDTSADLNEEFVVFWKNPDLIGMMLSKKIVVSYLKRRKVPARAFAWLAHWLVFQGWYKNSILILNYVLSRVKENGRLRGEVFSLVGNYYYSMDEIELSRRFHEYADAELKKSKDYFFQVFNIGTSAKTYVELGDIDLFNSNILGSYDHLDPSIPDERYGMRVLIYASYLYFSDGNVDIGKQFYASAEKSFLASGSPLDKSIYCMYKASILLYFRDIEGAKKTAKDAKRYLKEYGTYIKYEKQIESILNYLYGDTVSPQIISRILTSSKDQSKRDELEKWYHQFFSTIIPKIEEFQNKEITEIIPPLEKITNSTIELVLLKEEILFEDIETQSDVVVDHRDKSKTTFSTNVYHGRRMYQLKLLSAYKEWRNPEIFGAIKSLLLMIHSSSRKDHIKMLIELQNQKVKEGEIARRISHDIFSPLTALSLAVEKLDQKSSQYQIIHSSAKRIAEITNSLSRKRSTVSNSPEKFLVKTFIDTLVSCKKIESPLYEIELSYYNKADAQYLFLVESELSRTLSNLINNAVEASQTSGKVEVCIDVIDSVLNIKVIDHGIGISEKDLARVFEKNFTKKSDGSPRSILCKEVRRRVFRAAKDNFIRRAWNNS